MANISNEVLALMVSALVAEKPQMNWLNKMIQYKADCLAIANALKIADKSFNKSDFLKACEL